MLGIKIQKEKANEELKKLKEMGLLAKNAKAFRRNNFVLIPLRELTNDELREIKKNYEIIDAEFIQNKESKSFSEIAKEIVPKELEEKLKTAFDVVGDIGILEIDEELRQYEKELGEALLKTQTQLKTAVRKEGAHQTPLRIQKYKHLAGEKKTKTIHKENGIEIEVDIEKAYFSPRLSNERKRIASLVKRGEDVLVMFSGIAPYVCVIGKNAMPRKIYGIELNPEAHELAKRNIKRNKINNATLIQGDVKEVCNKIQEKFDRIIMPLPKGAEDFISDALKCAKEKCTIHLYQFASSEEIKELKKRIKKSIEGYGWIVKEIEAIRCGQQAPNIYRLCLDIKIEKKG
ncbi:MAG: tRNA (guanine37-N1)-methyltransferase [Candidatus Woesearchaeota archaeon]|nr:tRNA (guanine37-N1)-methyltransferase [Candidatus Woesearchaeota archaeon]